MVTNIQPRKKIVVLNGMHGSGKSTVGGILAQFSDTYSYYHEIGGEMRQKVDYNALKQFHAYDYEIMMKEAARNKRILKDPLVPIVETWHIGNLAYVEDRSSEISKIGEDVLINALESFDPFSVYLDISESTLRTRVQVGITPHNMEGLLDFNKRIRERIFNIYQRFNIGHCVVHNDGSVEETLSEIRRQLTIHNFNKEIVSGPIERR